MSERETAGPEEMDLRRELAEQVRYNLPAGESETSLSKLGKDSRLQITTYHGSWVRGLLEHDHAKIKWVWVQVDGGRGRRVPFDDLDGPPDRNIEGVCATLPVGAFTIKGSPRTNDQMGEVVNTPADAEAARENFGHTAE